MFLLFGRGACVLLLFGRFFVFFCLGGGREFTHLPVCLTCIEATQQQKRPNSKKKTRVPPYSAPLCSYIVPYITPL